MANYKLDYTGEQVNTAIGNALSGGSGGATIKGHSITFNLSYTNNSNSCLYVIWLDNALILHYDVITYSESSTRQLTNVYKIIGLYAGYGPGENSPNYIRTSEANAICFIQQYPGADYSIITTSGIQYINTNRNTTQFNNRANALFDLYVLKDTVIEFMYAGGGGGN